MASNPPFCKDPLNLTVVSNLPVGGKVHWILLTHPGGALCFTSESGTNVFKMILSSNFSILFNWGMTEKKRQKHVVSTTAKSQK